METKKQASLPARQGFIQIIIIVVLLVIILSLLGVSLSSLFSNPVLKDNFGFLWDWISHIWIAYLGPAFHSYAKIFIDFIWRPFTSGLQRKI